MFRAHNCAAVSPPGSLLTRRWGRRIWRHVRGEHTRLAQCAIILLPLSCAGHRQEEDHALGKEYMPSCEDALSHPQSLASYTFEIREQQQQQVSAWGQGCLKGAAQLQLAAAVSRRVAQPHTQSHTHTHSHTRARTHTQSHTHSHTAAPHPEERPGCHPAASSAC